MENPVLLQLNSKNILIQEVWPNLTLSSASLPFKRQSHKMVKHTQKFVVKMKVITFL